jgi:hypothetical protein
MEESVDRTMGQDVVNVGCTVITILIMASCFAMTIGLFKLVFSL